MSGLSVMSGKKNKKKLLIGVLALFCLVFALHCGVVLALDTVPVVINGEQANFDVKPYIKDGNTMVPVWGVAEALQIPVNWDEAKQQVTVSRDTDKLLLYIGSEKAQYCVVNSKASSEYVLVHLRQPLNCLLVLFASCLPEIV